MIDLSLEAKGAGIDLEHDVYWSHIILQTHLIPTLTQYFASVEICPTAYIY